MSLKSVEMQIAVPRTTEAGKIQQEQHQRPSQEQLFLSAEQLKDSKEAAQRSTEVDQSSDAIMRDGGKGGSQSQSQKQGEELPKDHKLPAADHPYKGRNLDITL
ncbi:hypothetical protein JJQ72_17255 [Paenibacillus sp. F411]|uniref:hypothetical protein n=1 Tax=Paenibacillus sp. F411 TaxID=2820239 RepID=UPI001AAEE49F|nr:hypothetical protein [Paenibacillus sp. F411]